MSIDLQVKPDASTVAARENTAAGNRSIYSVAMPYDNLPGARLVLETADRVFRRPIQIAVERPADRLRRDSWLDVLASAVWQHADQESAAPALELAVPAGDFTKVLVIVSEGDNRPLPISAARLLLPTWRLRFYKPDGALRLVYGRSEAAVPQYDLALLAPAVMGAEAREIGAAAESAAASASAGLVSPRFFWIGLAAAVVILLGLIVRLVSKG
jgi:hypothetical protein